MNHWYNNTLPASHRDKIINLIYDDNLCIFNLKNDDLNLRIYCYDLFYRDNSDVFPIDEKELPLYADEVEKSADFGKYKWCCRKLKLQPRKKIAQEMKDAGAWDDELESFEAPEDIDYRNLSDEIEPKKKES